ncbi:MAG: hypothetical protein LBT23_04880 [Synergistaceae bacterium]|nr:hypothetical protein [Synergistaceae bacterium]
MAPILLKGKIKRVKPTAGDKIFLEGFGAGLSWGAVVLTAE